MCLYFRQKSIVKIISSASRDRGLGGGSKDFFFTDVLRTRHVCGFRWICKNTQFYKRYINRDLSWLCKQKNGVPLFKKEPKYYYKAWAKKILEQRFRSIFRKISWENFWVRININIYIYIFHKNKIHINYGLFIKICIAKGRVPRAFSGPEA